MKNIITLLSITVIMLSFSCGKKNSTAVKDIKTRSGIEMVSLRVASSLWETDTDAHKVSLSPFYIDKYEVTQEMFKKIELPNPFPFQG